VGLLQLYWQLFGSNFLGTGTVLAEESTWRWVSCSCTGSCLAAISLVPALYWQKSWHQPQLMSGVAFTTV
jgi:hypothetical protein